MSMSLAARTGTAAVPGTSGRRPGESSPKAKPKAKSSLSPGKPKARARPLHAEVGTQTELRLPSMSLRSVMKSGKSERSVDLMDMEDGSPMPFQLKVTKADSGTTSGTSDDPRTPVRRNSWELSSLDPSTWPVFGITDEGIGITTNDGQTLDVEKSADFGFDRSLDGQQLASILEGIESGMLGESSFTSPAMARDLEDALARAEEENEPFRHLCWDLISLGRDLEEAVGFQEPPNHQQLLEEARRCLELVRERLDLRKQLEQQTEAVPEMEVPAPESSVALSRGGSLKLIHPDPGPGSCRLASPSFSPLQAESRSLVASCSAPTLPWSACCPVARSVPVPQLVPLATQLPLNSPQVVSRLGDSCTAQVTRFSSDGPLHGNSAQYPCEPVTRGVSPLRESPTTTLTPSPVSFGYHTGPPFPATQPGLPTFQVSQRHSPKWIGSWIRRTSCEAPKVIRMGSFEGAIQQC